mgnify:CR=1 FL=1
MQSSSLIILAIVLALLKYEIILQIHVDVPLRLFHTYLQESEIQWKRMCRNRCMIGHSDCIKILLYGERKAGLAISGRCMASTISPVRSCQIYID